jgi:hypothetical protein
MSTPHKVPLLSTELRRCTGTESRQLLETMSTAAAHISITVARYFQSQYREHLVRFIDAPWR